MTFSSSVTCAARNPWKLCLACDITKWRVDHHTTHTLLTFAPQTHKTILPLFTNIVINQPHTPHYTHAHATRPYIHHLPPHSPTTCSSIEIRSPRFFSLAHLIASYPYCIVVIDAMESAWLTLQQHALDISTLTPFHSTPKGTQLLHTHHHLTGEDNTHLIFVVDICFGFD